MPRCRPRVSQLGWLALRRVADNLFRCVQVLTGGVLADDSPQISLYEIAFEPDLAEEQDRPFPWPQFGVDEAAGLRSDSLDQFMLQKPICPGLVANVGSGSQTPTVLWQARSSTLCGGLVQQCLLLLQLPELALDFA